MKHPPIDGSRSRDDLGVPVAQGAALGHLTSALVADALDELGARDQCLPADIQGLYPAQRLVGPAFPVLSVPAADPTPAVAYVGLLAALDDMPRGSVFVFATGRSDAAGIWGELITTACLAIDSPGALTDGLVRDRNRVAELGYPVFSRGTTPADSKGRVDVIAHGVPVVIGGVTIAPNDLIVGDADGVVVVPAALVQAVMMLVTEKERKEDQFRAALKSGASASQAFRAIGIL